MSGVEQQQSIFLITGNIQGGKTTYLSELIEVLKKRDLSVGGFLAPGSFASGKRSGFTLKHSSRERRGSKHAWSSKLIS